MQSLESNKVPAAFMGCGILVALAAILFPDQTIQAVLWTEADAQRHSKASAELHDASYGANHKHDHSQNTHTHSDPDPEKLAAAKQAFQESQAKLEAAQHRHKFLRDFFLYAGAAVAAVGVFLHWRQSREQTSDD